MSNNALALYVVLSVLLFLVWAFWFLKRNGLLDSGKTVEKAKQAWGIYLEAQSPDQKVVASCIVFILLTHSLVRVIFSLLTILVVIAIGGALNNSIWQFLTDLIKDVVKPLIPHVPPGAIKI